MVVCKKQAIVGQQVGMLPSRGTGLKIEMNKLDHGLAQADHKVRGASDCREIDVEQPDWLQRWLVERGKEAPRAFAPMSFSVASKVMAMTGNPIKQTNLAESAAWLYSIRSEGSLPGGRTACVRIIAASLPSPAIHKREDDMH